MMLFAVNIQRCLLKEQASSRKTSYKTFSIVNAEASLWVPMLSSPVSSCLLYAAGNTVNNLKKKGRFLQFTVTKTFYNATGKTPHGN
jgi:hypothetical protein